MTTSTKDAGLTRLRYVAQLAVVCGVYFGLAKAGLEFAFANQSVTSVWPPTGFALATLVLWGQRMWPAVAVGAFLANITTAGPVLSVLGIATGNTLEAVVGAYLLTRIADFNPTLERVKDVSGLVLYGAVLATMISATIGVTSLFAADLVPEGELFSTWRVWWLGDAGGALIVAPALLVLGSVARLSRRPRVRLDVVALLALLVAVTVVAFTIEETLAYVIFPVLFWIALRLHQPGTVVAGVIVSGISIWLTAQGEGPFAGGSPDAELLRSQTFVGVATITGLLAAALISERRRAADQLRYLADHDQMTGLLNRRRFTEELEKWFAYNSRYDVQGAVLVIDVDDFKDVNDALGHQAGDELISRLGNLLRRRLRETDVVARWGGDEFTVLLPRASEEHAWIVASALLAELREEGNVTVDGRTRYVTVSIGVVPFGPDVAVEPRDILAHADAAMYGAKNAGRDQVKVYDADGSAAAVRPAAASSQRP